jgi:hypothetical protein
MKTKTKTRSPKPLLILCVFCLGLLAIGGGVAQDTYDAYPSGPTQVPTPTPTTTQASGQSTTVTPVPVVQPVVQPAATTTATVTTPATTATMSTVTAVYSTQAPPAAQQDVLLTYDVQTTPPAAVYYSGSYLPWTSFYQVFPANSPALWIASSAGWSWYATCPVGGWMQERMYVPVTGTMGVYDLYPDGTTKHYSYGFTSTGYKSRWFRADTPGRYMTMLTIADIPSNYIIIDVA